MGSVEQEGAVTPRPTRRGASPLVRFASVGHVPLRIRLLTSVAVFGALGLGLASGWPLWAVVAVATVPVIPLLTMELSWTYRHYGWLAFFYLLVVTQTGHFIEHLVQVWQIHVLDQAPSDAHGIFGRLDIEWVHVIFNTWVLIAVIGLLLRFPQNRWLWLGGLIAGWHEIEHLYIIFFYIRDGLEGNPGLLSDGGRIGGGLNVRRPDLHFVYNVVETLPIYVGFAIEVRRGYSRWLASAFPQVSRDTLVKLTSQLRTQKHPAGAAIVTAGELSDAMYVVTSGEVEVVRPTGDIGRRVATLGPGQIFGETGVLEGIPRTASVLAVGPAEVIRLDQTAVDELLRSPATADELRRLVGERAGGPSAEPPPNATSVVP